MATFSLKPSSSLITIILSLAFISFTTAKQPDRFAKTIDPNSLGFKKEKLSHLHFYFHDIFTGPNPTAIRLISPPRTNPSSTTFGMVNMVDNPLTLGPEPTSKLVGYAQGIYASTSQQDLVYLVAVTFSFIEGKYNGSSLSIFGRNPALRNVREMPLVGGTGIFRLARGYTQSHTLSLNATTGDAIVEYNVFVLHY